MLWPTVRRARVGKSLDAPAWRRRRGSVWHRLTKAALPMHVKTLVEFGKIYQRFRYRHVWRFQQKSCPAHNGYRRSYPLWRHWILSVYLSLSAIFTNINIKWSVTCTAAQTPEHLIWIWYNLMVIFRLLALLLAAVQTHEYVVYSLEWLFFLTWVHFLFLLLEHSSQMILWMISWTTFWTILWTISGTIFRNLFGLWSGPNRPGAFGPKHHE